MPILKDNIDFTFEKLALYYQTDFVYSIKDVFFYQKKMRKNAITSYKTMLENIRYIVIIAITADFYEFDYNNPTLVKQGIYSSSEDEYFPENLKLYNGNNLEYLAEIGYNHTRYIIKIPLSQTSEEYKEGAYLIKDYILEAL